MERLNVNLTRMEVKRLKGRLSTCVRGHKLLKDKADEMIRVFSVRLKTAAALRLEVEKELADISRQFSMVGSSMSFAKLEMTFAIPSKPLNCAIKKSSVMGVEVPEIEVDSGNDVVDKNIFSESNSISGEEKSKGTNIHLPYSYARVTHEADEACVRIVEIMPKVLRLAALEHSVRSLGDEIEKNKRRVNALEYVMIPQLEETIHYIRLKLDENERGSLARLMKVKSMISK